MTFEGAAATVRCALESVARGELHCLPMRDGRVSWRLERAIPGRFDAFLSRFGDEAGIRRLLRADRPLARPVRSDIYVGVVERTTVYLDVVLKRKLKETAARRGVSEAKILRQALSAYLSRDELPALRPVGRSTDGGVADRVDAALDEPGFGRT